MVGVKQLEVLKHDQATSTKTGPKTASGIRNHIFFRQTKPVQGIILQSYSAAKKQLAKDFKQDGVNLLFWKKRLMGSNKNSQWISTRWCQLLLKEQDS